MDFRHHSIFARFFLAVGALFVLAISLAIPSRKRVVVFGGAAIISLKYWSAALNEAGRPSMTLVPSVFNINSRDDFDLVWMDLVPIFIRNNHIRRLLSPACSWFWIVRNARVCVAPVGGISFFGWLGLESLEIWLFKRRGIKIVTMTVGGDSYMMSLIQDPSLRFALQSSYPDRTPMEFEITKSVRRAETTSDVFICGSMFLDGFARADLMTPQPNIIDLSRIVPRSENSYRSDEGSPKDPIRILHAPNHRAFKGSSFLISAVDRLKEDGLNVELVLAEKMPNHELLRLVKEVDIVVDQLIFTGYALFALETMASGTPVICNLESPRFQEVMKRYSFFRHCPIISASPETVDMELRKLIQDPSRRKKTGLQGIKYCNNFHSFTYWQKTWQMFEDKEFNGIGLRANK